MRTLRLAAIRANHGYRAHINVFDLIQANILGRVRISRIQQLLAFAHSNFNSNSAENLLNGANAAASVPGSRPKLKPVELLPAGRSMLRMASDRPLHMASPSSIGHHLMPSSPTNEVMDIFGGILASRPPYIIDIYPPFPRAYTYRRTETRGVRESDKVIIAKSKAEQQRQVELNLFRLLQQTKALSPTISCEDHQPQIAPFLHGNQ